MKTKILVSISDSVIGSLFNPPCAALVVAAVSTPSIEDSMAMVGVALVLYGLIKLVSWTVSGPGMNSDHSM